MINNTFFKNNGPFEINKLLLLSNIENKNNIKNFNITDIKDLATANNTEITFFHSKKYEHIAAKTKALFCITTNNLSKILPNSCNPIIVENVLVNTALITKIFYPNSITDDFDSTVVEIEKTHYAEKIKFGKIKLNIVKEYKLEDAKQAHEDLEARKLLGPAVLIP